MPVKPPKKIKMSKAQLNALKERIRQRKLEDSDWEAVEAMVDTVDCLSQVIEEKNASIGRLCKYLIGAPTETAKNVLKNKEDGQEKQPPKEKPPAKKQKGHGRRSASEYTGGTKVTIEHPTLKVGDLCPGCEKGKVYELSMPAVCVYIQGQAPLKSTVYERMRLRCNLCGQIYVPA